MPAQAGIQKLLNTVTCFFWTPATGSKKLVPGLTRYPAQASLE